MFSGKHCDVPYNDFFEVLQHPDCIMIHNHPGNYCAGLSAADFMAADSQGVGLSIVVTKDLVCSMRFPENFWEEHSGEELAEYCEELFESTCSVIVSNDATTQSQYHALINQLVAVRFGLEFHCESFESWYKAHSASKQCNSPDSTFGNPAKTPRTDP